LAGLKEGAMSHRVSRRGASLALALAAASPAFAQLGAIEVGGIAGGEVADAGSPATVSLRLGPGQTVQLDAIPAPRAPDGLDLVMRVYDADGELVGEDDDSGGALNPSVTVTSDAGGLYRIEVDVLDEGGPFTLLARESVFVPEVTTPLVLSGGRAERRVAFPVDDDALFSFPGRRGEVYSITLVADESDEEGGEADPMIELFPGEGTAQGSLSSDDDGGGGLNSRIVAELPDDGPYTVRVSSLSGAGSARLAVARITPQDAAVGNLAYGRSATVAFTESSPLIIGETARPLVPYAMFRLPATPAPSAMAGRDETIAITATSAELDPWLEVGLDTPLGFAVILSNDDHEGLDSRLELDPADFDGADAADWWSKLRIRVSAPAGSIGEIEVNAERVTD
jgi:hypothetical protein